MKRNIYDSTIPCHATTPQTKENQPNNPITSYKSTQSGGESPHNALECDEDLGSIQIPFSSQSPQQNPAQYYGKSSSSFIREIHGLQPPPPQDIAELEVEEVNALWLPSNLQYSKVMTEKDKVYKRFPEYWDQQPQVSPTMRVILMDWMMEVSSEFTLKRETYHQSVYHVDKILYLMHNIRKHEFQLVGLTCLYIAAKNEEVRVPKLSEFAKAADNGYSTDEIKAMEKIILQKLQWMVQPNTPYSWLSWLMTQWDQFINYHFACVKYNNPSDFDRLSPLEKKKQSNLYESRFISFKQSNQFSYKRFRETVQVLDCAILDYRVVQIDNKLLALGLIYLMVSKYFYDTDYQLLHYNGPEHYNSMEQLDFYEMQYENAQAVQDLFIEFANAAGEIKSIEEVYVAVQALHGFLELELKMELPIVCRIQSKTRLESHYEEFLAYQTHNSNNLEFVTSKLRDEC